MEDTQEGNTKKRYRTDDENRRKLLLKEYELLTSLYIHEDNLREKRITISIIILLGLLGALNYLGPLLAGILAVIICIAGYIVHRLGQYWTEIRKRRALFIEQELGVLKIYSHEKNCFDEKNKLSMGLNHFFTGLTAARTMWVSIGAIWIIIIIVMSKKGG